MSDIILTADQERVKATVLDWFRTGGSPVFQLNGFAGTGKTALAVQIAKAIGVDRVRCGAFTWKAALRLEEKGAINCSSIHNLIYRGADEITETDDEGVERKRLKFKLKEIAAGSNIEDPRNYDLIIVDECSMVNEEMAKGLMHWGVPILAVGDPMQLPPVEGYSPWASGVADATLTEILRQEADSPINKVSMRILSGAQSLIVKEAA